MIIVSDRSNDIYAKALNGSHPNAFGVVGLIQEGYIDLSLFILWSFIIDFFALCFLVLCFDL
jgi:hypothetical protein